MSTSSLNIGLQGILTAQRAIDVTGSNIANVNTPGYSREQAILRSVAYNIKPFGPGGAGVRLDKIVQIKDESLNARLRLQLAGLGDAEVRSRTLQEAEGIFLEPSGDGLGSQINNFFNSLRDLSGFAEQPAQRGTVMETASILAQRFNELDNNLDRIQDGIEPELQRRIGQINERTSRVADLNDQIQRLVSRGQDAYALVDERDAVVAELSKYGKVTTTQGPNQTVDLLMGGQMLVLRDHAFELELVTEGSNFPEVRYDGDTKALDLGVGSIDGLMTLQKETLKSYRDSLDALAKSLIEGINDAHSTGVGVDGGYERLVSTTLVGNMDNPLATQNLPFNMQAGELLLSVTNTATGEVVQTPLAIDPDVDSLRDVATAITGVANMNATVSEGAITIFSAEGYQFDFSGRLDPNPGAIGTSTVDMSGVYTGSANDTYTLTALGGGDIGVTPGLQIQVTDSLGGVIALLDVGDTYVPGEPLVIGNGVTVSLGSGTIAGPVPGPADTLGLRMTADPDTSNALVALGINAMFTGSKAADIGVNPGLQQDSTLLAASRFDGSGDASNLLRMIGLEDDLRLSNGTRTFGSFYEDIVATAGVDTQQATQSEKNQQLLVQSLKNRQDEVSGVSIDEELLDLTKFQRGYQASARFVSVINDLTQVLVNI